jgi:acetoin utilization deacetylase AcuC-like enzyme
MAAASAPAAAAPATGAAARLPSERRGDEKDAAGGTGYVWWEGFFWHHHGTAFAGWEPAYLDAAARYLLEPNGHFESAASKRRIHSLLAVSGVLNWLHVMEPEGPAEERHLLRAHDAAYLERLRAACAGDSWAAEAGDYAPFGKGSLDIARRAVQAVLLAVDQVMRGRLQNAFCLVRPPGHHAERARGMGFCLLGNVAIAARYAQAEHGVRRVAVIDWDVHHGNGTENILGGDADCLCISIHQDRLYPEDTGAVTETGAALNVVNLPLPPGCGVAVYDLAFERVVGPKVRAFRPEIIFVCSGFDSGMFDPLGRMLLPSSYYATMTRRVVAMARELGHGRVIVSHEGGYSEVQAPFCGVAIIEGLTGKSAGLCDPYAAAMERYPWQAVVTEEARRAIDECAKVHKLA